MLLVLSELFSLVEVATSCGGPRGGAASVLDEEGGRRIEVVVIVSVVVVALAFLFVIVIT